MHASLLRIFSYSSVRSLWLGSFISNLGTLIHTTTFNWIAYELTHDKFFSSLCFCFMLLPNTLLGPFAGGLADFFDRKKLIIFSQFFFMLNAFLIGWAISQNALVPWMLLVSALFNGFISLVEMPARQALTSLIVPRKDLMAAIPFVMMNFQLARFLGPTLGKYIKADFGIAACFFINMVSYLALIYSISTLSIPKNNHQKIEFNKMRAQVLEGANYILSHFSLKRLLILNGCTAFFASSYSVLLPAITKDILKLEHSGFSTVMSWAGIGAVLSQIFVVATANYHNKRLVVIGAMIILCMVLSLLAFASNLYVVLFCVMMLGMCTMIQITTTRTVLQFLSPLEMRTRVIAVEMWVSFGFSALFFPIVGWLAENVLGLRMTLMTLAICMGIGVLYGISTRFDFKPFHEKDH